MKIRSVSYARSLWTASLGLALFATVATTNAQTALRAVRPVFVRQAAEAPPPPPPATNAPDASGCAPSRKSSGVCFGSQTFTTYVGAAAHCASGGGRLPTLGELVGYRAGPGSNETGIECSSDFDTGSGTLWCVGDHGSISGLALENQAATLSTKSAEFRCVTYLKQPWPSCS